MLNSKHFSKILMVATVLGTGAFSLPAYADEPNLKALSIELDTSLNVRVVSHCLSDSREWRWVSNSCTSVISAVDILLNSGGGFPDTTLASHYAHESTYYRATLLQGPLHSTSPETVTRVSRVLDLQMKVSEKLSDMAATVKLAEDHASDDQQSYVQTLVDTFKEIKALADQSPETFY